MLKFRLSVFSLLAVSLGLMLSFIPLHAQDDATRDPIRLAEQLMGYDDSPAFPDPTPSYKVGDTAQFWVTKADQNTPTQITATLTAATPGIYLWVEQGITYDKDKLQPIAERLDSLFTLLRITDNVGLIQVIPQTAAELQTLSLLPIPDVDNDPHLFILFAQNLNTTDATMFNPNDSLPRQLAPGGYSNQHELLMANVSALPGVALDNNTFSAVLLQQMIRMLTFYNNPHQAPWMREAMSDYLLLQTQKRDLTQADVAAFMSAPQTPITQLATVTSQGQEYGASQLFLRYVRQRFGSRLFHEWFTLPGAGLSSLDQVLQGHNVTDLVTNNPMTANDVFADFVMTNILNQPFGDGRFVYTNLAAAVGQIAAAPLVKDTFDFQLTDRAVNQLGTIYIGLEATRATDFTLFFQGQPQAPRLPIPGDGDNHFYWSGSELDQSATLTRSFDLTGVTKATLNFDAWYNMVDHWNYAYVEVSDDQGKNWKIMPTDVTTTVNTYGLSYGPGFTGISNKEGPRPFPYLGVGLEADGITINKILPDGPLVGGKVQAGDIIAGHDGQVWQSAPNLLAYLANFKPGDTISLYLKRGDQFFSTDVVLGVHPTRVFLPPALWLPQQVDLSAYAGKQIQVRFEAVSVADNADQGFAIDNITIPEIGYGDDAESGVQGWTLNGWQQMTNQVPQRFLVQYAQIRADGTVSTVAPLIGPHDTSTSGSWDFSLAPNETFVLAISGLNDNTTSPAAFNLSAQTAAPAPSVTATPGGATG